MIYDTIGPEIMDTVVQHGLKRKSSCTNDLEIEIGENNASQFGSSEQASKFFKLLEDAKQKLYPGCDKFSKLSLIVKLFQIKCLYGLSDKAVNSIMQLFKEVLPDGETLPKTFYEARKIICDLGLHYEKIHACVNDCMLFWKEHVKAESCLVCGESRWKTTENDSSKMSMNKKTSKKVPRKVLRYFPLKPRLQRLFMSSDIVADMTWHHDQRTKDGILRHPADSDAWKSFDELNPGFAKDPRNVRLGLATDGVNPFGNLSVSHSTWPVIAIVYNLPHWLCMKQPYCMLSLLIPGPKAPGNDIDVYLQPLVEELQELWYYRVDTYDAARKENFCLRAAILWTINDFSAYANLSGWSTKGGLAFPTCNKETPSTHLKYGRKFSYMSSHRFLPMNYKWRLNKRSFDGTIEKRSAPKKLSGNDVLLQLRLLKKVKFGKTKDGLNARRDLKEMGIRKELHPIMKDDGYSSNIAQCVNLKDGKVFGFKSHDCHILLEQLLPLAIRGIVPSNVYDAITEFSIFFREYKLS
ncbi:uncharacterized protein LOC122722088 [Manihot esculenta]|uniref:uncharacterized protein LOC122722088 n=1 Tax=Manihot esculenta TaxID=3983 RepID=UPI001CC3B76C|nr:uncharacterized protein LOC122722088 [Manihot esculenta]